MTLPESVGRQRDIERIIAAVSERLPDIRVQQWRPVYPGDDDGIWWFSLPGVSKDVQIEGPYGSCPFLVETDEQSSYEARTAHTVAEAVEMIVSYLEPLQEARG